MADRVIVYPGAIPLETDLLYTNKFSMIGLAKLASMIMGTTTYVHGLSCTPTSPASMVVNVSAGEIYNLQNVDGTAYSSLAADTTHSILKQGILLDSAAFTLTAPSTSGYSINYLIQATYSDTDGGSTVLPYYNATDPSTAWSGPNNSGTSQYTVRQGICTVSMKAGVPATTGTQTTPSPDTGYTGLYVITVAQGASTVVAGNIAQVSGAPFIPSTGLVDAIQKNSMIYAADTGVANAYIVNVTPKISSPSDGTKIVFKASAANTGASTIKVGTLSPVAIVSPSGAALQGGEITANGLAIVQYNSSTGTWSLVSPSGAVQVPTATQSGHAINLSQLQSYVASQTGRLINIQVFPSSGTYTKTAGAVKGRALVQGGGGAGGGSAANSGSNISAGDGGDAGSYGDTGLIDLTGVTTVPVTVGAGGTGSSAAAGTNGGSSSFGSYIVAPGGLGGASGNSQAATSTLSNGHATTSACTGTNVAVNIPGAGGYSGEVIASNRSGVRSGVGGNSQMGRGGNAQIAGNTALPGTGYGSGGAGSAGAGSYSSSAGAGANGANGIVIVLEYA